MPRILLMIVCATLSTPLLCEGQAQPQTAPAQPAACADPGPPEPVSPIKTDPTVAVTPAPPTPIAEQKAELGDSNTWNPDWDKLIEQALPPELLSTRREHAVSSLCPNFKHMEDADKRAFWAYFFQALAGAEAGLEATADARHTQSAVAVIDTVTRHTARQEGLLQLAYMDSARYGCDFDWDADRELPVRDPEKTILQPKNNLLCGIRILDNQLVTQRKPLLSKSSYWVTLRPGTLSYRLFLKQMANEPAACGAPRTRRRWYGRRAPEPLSEAENRPASGSETPQRKSVAAPPPAGSPVAAVH
jgi:hypothetical protein